MFLLRILLTIFCGLYKSYIEYRYIHKDLHLEDSNILHRSKKINFLIDTKCSSLKGFPCTKMDGKFYVRVPKVEQITMRN